MSLFKNNLHDKLILDERINGVVDRKQTKKMKGINMSSKQSWFYKTFMGEMLVMNRLTQDFSKPYIWLNSPLNCFILFVELELNY